MSNKRALPKPYYCSFNEMLNVFLIVMRSNGCLLRTVFPSLIQTSVLKFNSSLLSRVTFTLFMLKRLSLAKDYKYYQRFLDCWLWTLILQAFMHIACDNQVLTGPVENIHTPFLCSFYHRFNLCIAKLVNYAFLLAGSFLGVLGLYPGRFSSIFSWWLTFVSNNIGC